MEFIEGTALQGASRICFGCEQLGGKDWGNVDIEKIRSAIKLGISRGVNFFDTAAVYGLGMSETRLAETLGTNRDNVIIATKGGMIFEQPNGAERVAVSRDSSPTSLRESVASSIARMGVKSLPVFFIHWPDMSTPIEAMMQALMELKAEGKIQRIGLSNFSLEQLIAARQVGDVDVVQIAFSLISRQASDIVEFCRTDEIAVCAYGVLEQGLLSGKYTSSSEFASNDRRHRLQQFQPDNIEENLAAVDRVVRIAQQRKRSPVQVAIRYALQYSGISAVIVGIKSSRQLIESSDVFDWKLSAQEIAFLECKT